LRDDPRLVARVYRLPAGAMLALDVPRWGGYGSG